MWRRSAGCWRATRTHSTAAKTPQLPFDRALKLKQRQKAAVAPSSRAYDYLRDEVAESLVARMEMISTDYNFPRAVDLGAGAGHVYRHLEVSPGIETLTQVDSCKEMLMRDADLPPVNPEIVTERVVCDEEHPPFEPASVDIVTSCLSLHWANDIQGTLQRVCRMLRPDGVFIGAVLGGETLWELKDALAQAEQRQEGGVGVHTSPMLDAPTVGSLLSGAGFSLPTVDVDRITFEYRDLPLLMQHLQGMGENSAATARRKFISRHTLALANSIYHDLHGSVRDGRPVIPATFDVIYMIGWSPHISQQRPLARGSASFSLRDIDNDAKIDEIREPSSS